MLAALIATCGQGSTHKTWYSYIAQFAKTADQVLGSNGHMVADNCQVKGSVGQHDRCDRGPRHP